MDDSMINNIKALRLTPSESMFVYRQLENGLYEEVLRQSPDEPHTLSFHQMKAAPHEQS